MRDKSMNNSRLSLKILLSNMDRIFSYSINNLRNFLPERFSTINLAKETFK